MKKYTRFYPLMLGAALALAVTACAEHEDNLPGTPAEGRSVTLIATQSGVQSRMAHEDASDKVVVKWTKEDAFALYGENRYEFIINETSIAEDGKSAEFTSSDDGLGSDTKPSFNAFFPYNAAFTTWEKCFFDVSVQEQSGNGTTTHLEKCNYMTASNVTPPDESTVSEISFKQEMALLKFKITFPTGVELIPTKLTLSAGGLYTQKGVTDASLDKTGSITLNLTGIDKTDSFTAYMMAIPGKLTGEFLLTVEAKDGTTFRVFNYLTTIAEELPFEYEAGYFYSSELLMDTSEEGNMKEASVFDNDVANGEGEEFSTGDDGAYEIYNARQLKKLVENVNDGTSYTGKTVRLMTDIHITADTWTPIGTFENPFKGTFDGGGHTISGKMIAVNNSLSYFGFFGNVQGVSKDASAGIKNLNVSAVVENNHTDEGFAYTGGIAGYTGYANITACHKVGGSVSSSSSSSSSGGIVGVSSYSSIANCSNSGSVSSSYSSGGIVGSSSSSIANCSNSGSVSSSSSYYSSSYSGGIVGESNSSSNSSIANCSNSGSVSSSSSSYSSSSYSGGIVGSSSNNSSIANCSNSGSVSSSSSSSSYSYSYSGGIVGSSSSSSNSSIANCSNSGSVSSSSSSSSYYYSYSGGIVGRIDFWSDSNQFTSNTSANSTIEATGSGTKNQGVFIGWAPTAFKPDGDTPGNYAGNTRGPSMNFGDMYDVGSIDDGPGINLP